MGAESELMTLSSVTLSRIAQDASAVQPLVWISRLFTNTDDVFYW